MLKQLTVLFVELFVLCALVALTIWSDRRRHAREAREDAERKRGDAERKRGDAERKREDAERWLDEKHQQDAIIRECLDEVRADLENLQRLRADVDARLWAARNKQSNAMVN